MASNYEIMPDPRMVAVTASHRDDRFSIQDNQVQNPTELDYRNVQNQEDLLGDFILALRKLEGLLYAVCGAVPASYQNHQGWWLHPDPRVLWPEQSFEHVHNGDMGDHANSYRYFQTAARGRYGTEDEFGSDRVSDTGYIDWSRSEDMDAHYVRRSHDTTWFPPRSLTRTTFESNYGDPSPGDAVVITYNAPEALRTRISTVQLYYRTVHGSSDQVEHSPIAMHTADEGATYTGTLPAQEDDRTIVLFAVKVVTLVTEGSPPQTIWEPRGSAEPTWTYPHSDGWDYLFTNLRFGDEHKNPATTDCYYYAVFAHTAVYQYGLPELLWQEFHPEHRRCTGAWRLDSIEQVTPGLINVARWACDSFGRMGFQHDPRRGESPSCCFDMPIAFRWTGGAKYPHYQDGGKVAGDLHPISNNLDEVPGTGYIVARTYWRGAPNIYAGLSARALLYGSDESWKTWPMRVIATCDWTKNGWSGNPELWFTVFDKCGRYRGLRCDDRVTVDHVKEIIFAVDYLLTSGLWFTRPVQTCMATPTCFPLDEYIYPGAFWVNKTWAPAFQYNGWGLYWDPSTSQDQAIPFAAPSSVANCRAGTGTHVARGTTNWIAWYQSVCDTPRYDYGETENRKWFAMGCHSPSVRFFAEVWLLQDWDSFTRKCGYGAKLDDEVWPGNGVIAGLTKGYAHYICGPSRYWKPVGVIRSSGSYLNEPDPVWSGIDEDHGNLYSKRRGPQSRISYGGSWFEGASMGNNCDLAIACHSERSADAEVYHKEVSFDGITRVQFAGLGTKWAKFRSAPCDCRLTRIDQDVPSIPGFGYYGERDDEGGRAPLCDFNPEYIGSTRYASDSITTFDPALGGVFLRTNMCPTGFHDTFSGLVIYRDGISYAVSTAPNEDGTIDIHEWDPYGEVIGHVVNNNWVQFNFAAGHTWRLDYSYWCQLDTQEIRCDLTLTSRPNCDPNTPMVYQRVDLNLVDGIPRLKDHHLSIHGTVDGSTVYPDQEFSQYEHRTYGGVFTPCIDGE